MLHGSRSPLFLCDARGGVTAANPAAAAVVATGGLPPEATLHAMPEWPWVRGSFEALLPASRWQQQEDHWQSLATGTGTLWRTPIAGADNGWLLEWQSESAGDEFACLRAVLQALPFKLMLADASHRITHINDALLAMFRRQRDVLCSRFPQFDPERLVGQSLDLFHRHPAHQRQALEQATAPIQATVSIGPVRMELTAIALRDAQGRYLGTCAIWDDIHAVHELIRQVGQGDLDSHLDPAHFDGSQQMLVGLLNGMLEQVRRPLQRILEQTAALARGQLLPSGQLPAPGLFGRMASALDQATADLARMIASVQHHARVLVENAGSLQQGSAHLNQRSDAQARALAQFHDSLDLMALGFDHSHDRLVDLLTRAAQAAAASECARQRLHALQQAMDEDAQRHRQMVELTQSLDRITLQSRLLSLNAGVEAARAGQQGKGFAVVSEEMTRLATQSAQSAGHIRQRLQAAERGLQESREQARQACSELDAAGRGISDVAHVLSVLADQQMQQRSTVHETLRQIDALQRIGSENQSLAAHTALTASSLHALARQLQAQTRHFQLAETSAAALSATAEAAPA